MDDSRRAELYARRTAMLEAARDRDHAKRRADYVQAVPILAALEAAGEDYDSFGYWRLRGALNLWAHKPDRWGIAVETHAPLPADPAAAILAALREHVGADGRVTAIVRSEELVLELRLAVLERHLATLIANAPPRELGFAAPPADWFVELGPAWFATGRLKEEP